MRDKGDRVLPEMLSVYDVAKWLGQSPSWVRKQANDDRIPGVKVGKIWFFSAHELARWIERVSE
jgi:hypothetical protein